VSPQPGFSDEQLEAAISRLSEPGRMREVEAQVVAAAPRLQKVLAQALEDGGWFAESHEQEVTRIADIDDDGERLIALRTLLAEETRIGMMVGVAVGWALSDELQLSETDVND
jgi:hypothetical protein